MASAFPIRPGNRREDGRPPDRPMIRAEGTGELVRLPSIDITRISFAAMGGSAEDLRGAFPENDVAYDVDSSDEDLDGMEAAVGRFERRAAERESLRAAAEANEDAARRLATEARETAAAVESLRQQRRRFEEARVVAERRENGVAVSGDAGEGRVAGSMPGDADRPSSSSLPTTRSASSATFARGEGGWTSASRGCWRRRPGTTGNERWSRVRIPPGTTSSPSPWATASDTGEWRRRRRRRAKTTTTTITITPLDGSGGKRSDGRGRRRRPPPRSNARRRPPRALRAPKSREGGTGPKATGIAPPSPLVSADAAGDVERLRSVAPAVGGVGDDLAEAARAIVENRAEDFARTLAHLTSLVDARDEVGDTLLHLAASLDRKRCVKTLVRAGANVGARNDAGVSVVERAIEHERFELADYLVKWCERHGVELG